MICPISSAGRLTSQRQPLTLLSKQPNAPQLQVPELGQLDSAQHTTAPEENVDGPQATSFPPPDALHEQNSALAPSLGRTEQSIAVDVLPHEMDDESKTASPIVERWSCREAADQSFELQRNSIPSLTLKP